MEDERPGYRETLNEEIDELSQEKWNLAQTYNELELTMYLPRSAGTSRRSLGQFNQLPIIHIAIQLVSEMIAATVLPAPDVDRA